jgi:predicted homoserine dehydrogenase-like protein
VYDDLVQLEQDGRPIRVAVTGAGGAMGRGLALQIGATPGMRLVAAIDLDLARAQDAARLHGQPWRRAGSDREVARALQRGQTVVGDDAAPVLDLGRDAVDVLIESTNTVGAAARTVMAASRAGVDAVLMNAEVDCLLGPLLRRTADEAGAIVTSDAGDQHGVLMRMIDEIRLWGFDIVMAGNIKGFLDRYATPTSIASEARARNLNPVQCASYTDGTKLNVEMALVANATGFLPARRGMLGPAAESVEEVFAKFALADLPEPGCVDYILGAQPGGGVFVVGRCDTPVQREYLHYYKLGRGPFYLFYRPYHLCHLETTYALGRVALDRKPVFTPRAHPVAEVIAVAKRDLVPGTALEPAIGGEHLYGQIETVEAAGALDAVPICLLECDGERAPVVARAVRKDEPLRRQDVELPDSDLLDAYRRQERMLTEAVAWSAGARRR